jgi:hypothetical protein
MKFYLLLAFMAIVSSAFAEEAACSHYRPIKDPAALLSTEIGRLDTLIEATEKSLVQQRKLKLLIVEYKSIQDKYLLKPNDNDLLYQMIKSAYKTLKSIKEYHLVQTFDKEFIEELTIVSQPIKK